jgi:hypothetical protein
LQGHLLNKVTHEQTPRTEALIAELNALGRDIEAWLLPRASADAKLEWFAIRAAWPNDDHARDGASSVSEAELARIVEKVRRFRQILRGPQGDVA